jgi:hypothetical protein
VLEIKTPFIQSAIDHFEFDRFLNKLRELSGNNDLLFREFIKGKDEIDPSGKYVYYHAVFLLPGEESIADGMVQAIKNNQ